MKVAIIGSGSWGTALAAILGEKGLEIRMWARRAEIANEINSKRENPQYLPNVKIPSSVKAHSSLQNAIDQTDLIISAIPSEFLRSTMKNLKQYYSNQIIVSVTKGLEHSTSERMSQVIENEIGTSRIAVLSGPNHAEEIGAKKPTASVLASKNRKVRNIAAEVLSTPLFKIYQLDDAAGVQICGALKNITAIATGVVDGFEFGDNAKASIITLGLMEINNFGRYFGAKRGTVYGLAGVGDLIATCISRHSRNRYFGLNIARGKTIEQARLEMNGMVAEGIPTTKAVHEYIKNHDIEMPLTKQAYEVLFEGKDVKRAISDLLRLI